MIQGKKEIKEITLNYDLAHILIQKIDGKLKANVQLSVTDQEGNFIESLVTTYEGEEYNTWWDNFNSWNEVLAPILTPKSIVIPETIEEEFVNISENPVEEELNP